MKVKIAMKNLKDLKAKHLRSHTFIVYLRLYKLIKRLKSHYDRKITNHRQQSILIKNAQLITYGYLRFHKRAYGSLDRKIVNKIRHSLTLFSTFKDAVIINNCAASIIVTKFLAATQRLDNLKKMTYNTIEKCRMIRTRGKQITCMNYVRMCILRQMWND